MQERNKSLSMPENMQFVWEIFSLGPVAYITVNFRKVASDLFQAGSVLVESEPFKPGGELMIFSDGGVPL